jgi:phage tail-like protein
MISAAQIGLPQVATPASVGSAASTAGSAARSAATLPFRKLGLAMRFKVVVEGVGIPGLKLGLWTSCEGLKVEFKYDTVRSGGDYTNKHVLPQHVNYSPITLKRAVEGPWSEAVKAWLQDTAAAWQAGDISRIGRPVTISLLDVTQNEEDPAAYWTLANAFPASWTGPSMSAKSSDIATETLVLEHDGFLAALP